MLKLETHKMHLYKQSANAMANICSTMTQNIKH